MSSPVKVTIGDTTYGGIIRDQSADVDLSGSVADIDIRIPLSRKSIELLQRKGFQDETFLVSQSGIDTTYKLTAIARVVDKFLISVSGQISE